MLTKIAPEWICCKFSPLVLSPRLCFLLSIFRFFAFPKLSISTLSEWEVKFNNNNNNTQNYTLSPRPPRAPNLLIVCPAIVIKNQFSSPYEKNPKQFDDERGEEKNSIYIIPGHQPTIINISIICYIKVFLASENFPCLIKLITVRKLKKNSEIQNHWRWLKKCNKQKFNEFRSSICYN